MKTKTCLLILFSCIILFICSIISMFAGFTMSETKKENDEEAAPAKEEITEQPVYYDSNTSERYIDTDSQIFEELLQQSASNFTVEYDVQDSKQFEEDQEFILANLEKQYSRLSVKFNKNITEKITVKIIDDVDTFASDLGTLSLDILGFSAFSLGGDLIEIYLDPTYTADKYSVAHTLSHELVHIFQYQLNNDISKYNTTWYEADWFIEGMAEWFSYPNEDSLVHSEVYKAIPDVNTLNSLVDSFDKTSYTIGYDAAELFFAYLSQTYGDDKLINVLSCTTDFDACFNQQIGVLPGSAYSNWLSSL